MSEKIKGLMNARRGSFADWLFIHAIAKHAKRVTGGVDIHAVPGWEKLSSEEVEVCLTFDGVEVPFLQCMQDMDEQRERMVKEQAGELLDEKLNAIDDMLNDIRNAIRAKATGLGLIFRCDDEEAGCTITDRYPYDVPVT